MNFDYFFKATNTVINVLSPEAKCIGYIIYQNNGRLGVQKQENKEAVELLLTHS